MSDYEQEMAQLKARIENLEISIGLLKQMINLQQDSIKKLTLGIELIQKFIENK